MVSRQDEREIVNEIAEATAMEDRILRSTLPLIGLEWIPPADWKVTFGQIAKVYGELSR